jgi:hypothetical protein
MTKRMFSKDDSWVSGKMLARGMLPRGADLQPYGRMALVHEATKWCSYSSSLAPDHCKVLHTQLTRMQRDFPNSRVEFGMYERRDMRKIGSPVNWAWPYAALAIMGDSAGMDSLRVEHGFLIVPCAPACSRVMQMGIPIPGGVKYRIELPNMFSDLVPVTEEVTGGGSTVTVDLKVIASREMLRRGDAFLLDLGEHSPKVRVNGTGVLGPACRFGGIDEMLDAARCRLAFAQLPMA